TEGAVRKAESRDEIEGGERTDCKKAGAGQVVPIDAAVIGERNMNASCQGQSSLDRGMDWPLSKLASDRYDRDEYAGRQLEKIFAGRMAGTPHPHPRPSGGEREPKRG